MSKLHDIFIDHYGEELLIPNSDVMEQAIKALMLEIIGEDSKDADFNSSNHILKERAIANNIKAEQRKALDEL